MSILEAIEDIQKRTRNRIGKQTEKRLDTCARQFAQALMDSYPDLMFWQNTPPDPEDLPKEKADLVPETVRQACPCPVKTCGHMVGSWLLDVYAGSRKAVQFGNKWDAPYPFNYSAKFKDGPIPPEVANLPPPLMRDFRADRNAIRALCEQAARLLKPPKGKGPAVYTKYVDKAAMQVAVNVNKNRDSILNLSDIINQQLERFHSEDIYSDWPISEIRFSDKEKNSIEITYHLGRKIYLDRAIKSKVLKKSGFIRKIRESLAQLEQSRQSRTNN